MDIKGPMAAQVYGVGRLVGEERPAGDVYVTGVVQEEIGGVGARHMAETLWVPLVVVGDFEGYVHFFNNFDGGPVARERVGKGMISGPPVVMGDKLFVQSESGALAAFTVRMSERNGDDQDVADAADEET